MTSCLNNIDLGTDYVKKASQWGIAPVRSMTFLSVAAAPKIFPDYGKCSNAKFEVLPNLDHYNMRANPVILCCLWMARKDHDVESLRRLLPLATNLGVSSDELESAQNIVNFEAPSLCVTSGEVFT